MVLNRWGIGISIFVAFKHSSDTENTIEFAAAGGDLIL